MSHTTDESDDAMYSNHRNESPAADIGSGCRSRWTGTVLKKGPWTTAEDAVLIDYVQKHGEGNWNAVQKYTGLSRCGKSCRLRWANHLRPNLKKGAFSPEEEQLIVELHAKMGNKWARMAAHLPGRTDNEIKNYWNTRIKRRQRAGLPLYPPEMQVQASQWNQEYTNSDLIGIDRRPLSQVRNCEPNVLFDSLKVVSGMVPSASDLSDISACNMMGNATSSSRYKSFMPPIMQQPKRLRESGPLFPGYCSNAKYEFSSPDEFQSTAPQKIPQYFGFSFSRDADPPDGNQHYSNVIPGNHTLMDAIFPTSKPSFGTVKLELPSFQYPETNFDQWKAPPSPHSDLLESVDAYIQSPPPTGKVEPDCYSSCDTGLLDMMLHEAKIKTSNGSISSEKSFSSTTTPDIAEGITHSEPETKYKEIEDTLKPLVNSEIPLSKQFDTGGSSSGESRSPIDNFAWHNVKTEQWGQIWTPKRENEMTPPLDITRPDVLLASSWLDHGLGFVKETTTMLDTPMALLSDDLGNEYMHMAVGTSSSSSGQARAVGSCAWSNMPAVCQMTELP